MKENKFKIPALLALIYWLPASIALLDIMDGTGFTFPEYIDHILMPGYILGFIFGFGGGSSWALLGQLITFLILFFILRILYTVFVMIFIQEE